jgi:hypothetical protein
MSPGRRPDYAPSNAAADEERDGEGDCAAVVAVEDDAGDETEEAIAQLTVEHEWVRHSSEIASATGLTDEEVALGIKRLAEAEHVHYGSRLHHPGGGRSYMGVGLLERGLREVGVCRTRTSEAPSSPSWTRGLSWHRTPNSARASRASGMRRSESAKKSSPEC